MRYLYRYTQLLIGCAFILILAGGLVTSTGSGLSVPDWPLSYGMLMPPMVGGIRFEHSHRMIAGCVGLLTLALSIQLFIFEKRRWVQWLGAFSVLLVIVQAVLGGLTVIYLLPKPISISHACLAQTFFILINLIAYFLSDEWDKKKKAPIESFGGIRTAIFASFILAYSQLVLGAVIRHTQNLWALYAHMGVAVTLFIGVSVTLFKIINHDALRRISIHSAFVLFIVSLQAFLGFGSYVYKFVIPSNVPSPPLIEVLFRTCHQGVGALVLASIALLGARYIRLYSPQ